MKTYNEKCDKVLLYLKDLMSANWDTFSKDTGIKKEDAIISYLKDARGFISHSPQNISISDKGLSFISETSFVSQRSKL